MRPSAVGAVPAAAVRRRPRCSIVDGFWAERQRINRERTIPHGFEQLRQHRHRWTTCGWRPARTGEYRAAADTGGSTFPFLDSDVYKWLEAVGWELGRAADPEPARRRPTRRSRWSRRRSGPTATSTATSRSSAAARRTRTSPGGTSSTASATCIQAAVAWHRALGDDRLLAIAIARRRPDRRGVRAGRPRRDRRPPRHRDGPGRADPGHRRARATWRSPPGCSTCAATGCSAPGGSGRSTGRTTRPSATRPTVAGHAVRQLYLDCGAVDVAVELGDDDAARRGASAAGTTSCAPGPT